MKKSSKFLLFSFAQILISNFTFSQVEFSLNTAYSFSTPNNIIGIQEKDVLESDLSLSNITGSLASGINFGLTTNIKIHEHVKLCLGFDMLQGNEVLFSNYDRNDTIIKLTGTTNQKRFTPGFMFHFPTKKVNFYVKTSLVLPLKTESEFYETSSVKSSGASIFTKRNLMNYNFNLGFQYALGAEVNLNKSFKFSLSLESISNNLTVKSSHLAESTQYNSNQIENLTFYDKNTNYHKNLNNFSNNLSYNEFTSSDKAKDELTFAHNFSSLLVKISFIYILKMKSE
ncbi:MAG: hypothetical protein V4622_08470 [Bacteroidota bacterium]